MLCRSLRAVVALAALCPASLFADVVYDDLMHAAGQYVQNFDSLPTLPVSSAFNGAVALQIAIPNLGEFDAAKLAQTSELSNFQASDGGSITAGLMSLGADGNGERALGALASGTRAMAFGFDLANAYAVGEITSITVEFWQETWRVPQSATNTFTAAWGTSDSGVADATYLSAATGMTVVSDLSLTRAAAGAAAAVNGNDAAFRVKRMFTFNVNLSVGEHFYLRWQDANEAGDDATLAIDDLKLTFTHSATVAAVPESSSLALVAAAGILAWWATRLRRRRLALRRS